MYINILYPCIPTCTFYLIFVLYLFFTQRLSILCAYDFLDSKLLVYIYNRYVLLSTRSSRTLLFEIEPRERFVYSLYAIPDNAYLYKYGYIVHIIINEYACCTIIFTAARTYTVISHIYQCDTMCIMAIDYNCYL